MKISIRRRKVGVLPIAISCLLASCMDQNQSFNSRLAKKIEAEISLPPTSSKVKDYSHYYSWDGGVIRGVYVIHSPEDVEFTRENCVSSGFKKFPCSSEDRKVLLVGAGKSTWVPRPEYLPTIQDGGCVMISFIYDPKKNQFSELACNGNP